jgi:hypothetical protein
MAKGSQSLSAYHNLPGYPYIIAIHLAPTFEFILKSQSAPKLLTSFVRSLR